MQTAINKAIRVGRATALAIGVGVMFALVLGLATVALAAVPGDTFKLGKVNVINNATTALQGTAPNGGALLHLKRDSGLGPVLKVENTQNSFARRGIDITVPAGQPPIAVNADAGRASNLNADKLDGLSDEDFLSASRIYDESALKPNINGTEKVTITALDGLRCDEGDVAINGGGSANEIEDDIINITPFGSSYVVEFQDNEPRGSNFKAKIICSDSSRPFRD